MDVLASEPVPVRFKQVTLSDSLSTVLTLSRLDHSSGSLLYCMWRQRYLSCHLSTSVTLRSPFLRVSELSRKLDGAINAGSVSVFPSQSQYISAVLTWLNWVRPVTVSTQAHFLRIPPKDWLKETAAYDWDSWEAVSTLNCLSEFFWQRSGIYPTTNLGESLTANI